MKGKQNKKGETTEDFWTDEQWAVLGSMEHSDRVKLMVDTIYSKRGLLGEARYQGLLPSQRKNEK